MWRSGNAQGAQCAHFAAVQPEAAEDRLLTLGEERLDLAQASGHLECPDREVGGCLALGVTN